MKTPIDYRRRAVVCKKLDQQFWTAMMEEGRSSRKKDRGLTPCPGPSRGREQARR
jgi:hypothetical protein